MGLRDGIDALWEFCIASGAILDQTVTFFSSAYLASPIHSSYWWFVDYMHKIPPIPLSLFFSAMRTALQHHLHIGYWKDTFHVLVETQILWDMHRRIPLAFP
jgi:hypothetical protein